jgi:hypothetical protein
MSINEYFRPGLISFTIIALIVNIIYLWNIERIGQLISLFIVNFIAILSGLIQLKLYFNDENVKKEIHLLYEKQYPPSVEELMSELEKIYGK